MTVKDKVERHSLVAFVAALLLLCCIAGCSNPKNKSQSAPDARVATAEDVQRNSIQLSSDFKADLTAFIPHGYVWFDTVFGDLNKDGVADCVLIIKGTDTNMVVEDERNGKEVDRNRRGLVVLLNKNGSYEQVVKNYNCFSSENEDGGIYYFPELSIEINDGKLFVQYSHGRYGYWKYTFRFQNSDMELIGYDASENFGPIVNRETSINYLTRKKIVKVNTNENAQESGEELFKVTTMAVQVNKPVRLSEIKDFDELDYSN
jgi:hypothetical protein